MSESLPEHERGDPALTMELLAVIPESRWATTKNGELNYDLYNVLTKDLTGLTVMSVYYQGAFRFSSSLLSLYIKFQETSKSRWCSMYMAVRSDSGVQMKVAAFLLQKTSLVTVLDFVGAIMVMNRSFLGATCSGVDQYLVITVEGRPHSSLQHLEGLNPAPGAPSLWLRFAQGRNLLRMIFTGKQLEDDSILVEWDRPSPWLCFYGGM
ncbi:hypothetical protein HAX54_051679 [Datura stramonium]|uniref:Uncharacterized protein n=1 Tax=Datura stramonium TaxID=4076 RepID=A0ABS8SXZ0_DATST|nr:hypothetical protein [Datura stramonium]